MKSDRRGRDGEFNQYIHINRYAEMNAGDQVLPDMPSVQSAELQPPPSHIYD